MPPARRRGCREKTRPRRPSAARLPRGLGRRGRGLQAALVLRAVELAVGRVPLLDWAPPRLVVAIPAHRLRETLGEGRNGLEAEAAELGGVERVAAIVPWTVVHVADQRLGVAALGEGAARALAVLRPLAR